MATLFDSDDLEEFTGELGNTDDDAEISAVMNRQSLQKIESETNELLKKHASKEEAPAPEPKPVVATSSSVAAPPEINAPKKVVIPNKKLTSERRKELLENLQKRKGEAKNMVNMTNGQKSLHAMANETMAEAANDTVDPKMKEQKMLKNITAMKKMLSSTLKHLGSSQRNEIQKQTQEMTSMLPQMFEEMMGAKPKSNSKSKSQSKTEDEEEPPLLVAFDAQPLPVSNSTLLKNPIATNEDINNNNNNKQMSKTQKRNKKRREKLKTARAVMSEKLLL